MADRLEMHVLAVGQGSCGLVCHYNTHNALVQLDLCDCGRSGGGITADTLDKQMELIRELMRKRAQDAEKDVELYLDNIILSHKDSDHINLFTNKYFLRGLIPSPTMHRKLINGRLERSRSTSLPRRAAGLRAGDADDDNELLMLRGEYSIENGNLKVFTVSAEYEWRSEMKEQLGYSLLTYQQRYNEDGAVCAADGSPFHYAVILPHAERHSHPENVLCRDFTLLLEGCPETGYLCWNIHTNASMVYEGAALELTMDIEWRISSSELNPYLHLVSNIYGENCVPLPPLPQAVAFSWETIQEELNLLAQGAREGFQWLRTEEGLAVIVPCISSEEQAVLCCQCLDLIEEIFDDSFQHMTAELSQVLQPLSEINGDYVFNHLFSTPQQNASNDLHTFAVGSIYCGGLNPAKSTATYKNVAKRLSTYCLRNIQTVSGVMTGPEEIYLIQMPLNWRKSPVANLSDSPSTVESYFNRYLWYIPSFRSTICGEITEISQEENSRSIMYIARDQNGYRAIFPGDATGDTIAFYMGEIAPTERIPLNDTWLAAPHHGSWVTCEKSKVTGDYSPLGDYLTELSPKCILISAGYPNSFSHPRIEFLAEASGHLPHGYAVAPHGLLYNDPNQDPHWIMAHTEDAIYSTVSRKYTPDGVPRSGLCYVNLLVASEDSEVTVSDPLQTLTASQSIHYIEPSDADEEMRPSGDFPFLFDEPADGGLFTF